MKCIVCDRMLSDFEATRRHKVTFQFLDLCTKCLRSIHTEVPFGTIDRHDLLSIDDDEDRDSASDSASGHDSDNDSDSDNVSALEA